MVFEVLKEIRARSLLQAACFHSVRDRRMVRNAFEGWRGQMRYLKEANFFERKRHKNMIKHFKKVSYDTGSALIASNCLI